MIGFSDSDGNVTICGQLDEWKKFLLRLEPNKIDEADPANSTHYMLQLAAGANKFRQRRSTDRVQN